MSKRLTLGGLDLSALVTSWGEIDRTATILLGQDTLLVSEHQVVLGNKGGWADPGGPVATIQGMDWFGESFQLYLDDRLVFDGTAINVKPSPTSKELVLVAQNALKAAADVAVGVILTAVDPGRVMLDALLQTRAAGRVDRDSFVRAGQIRAAAGALVNANYPRSDGRTALDVLQDVGDLASIQVLEDAGQITARAFQPYQGSGAGLGFPITDALVREWSPWEWDESAFKNRVEVGYPTDSVAVVDDLESQRRNKGWIQSQSFSPGGGVEAANKAAALALGKIYLERASLRRATTRATGGVELARARLGDRFPITSSSLQVTAYPAELIGTRLMLDDEGVEVTLAQLA